MIRMTAAPALHSSVTQLSTQQSPVEVIQTLLKERFPEAPTPSFKWCRGYYERCAAYTEDGGLVSVFFPPAINYVLDLGYENLIVFKDVLQANITGDATFPHWEKGQFYCAKKEEASDILFPFIPRDLIVGTKGITNKDELASKLKGLNVTVGEKIGDDSYVVKAPGFQEDTIAGKIRELPEIRYVERNGVVRIIDTVPGWLIDRIF